LSECWKKTIFFHYYSGFIFLQYTLFVVLGFELRAYTLSNPFLWGFFFEIGSLKLFGWAGFKPGLSLSLLPEKLGLQGWATGPQVYNIALLTQSYSVISPIPSQLQVLNCEEMQLVPVLAWTNWLSSLWVTETSSFLANLKGSAKLHWLILHTHTTLVYHFLSFDFYCSVEWQPGVPDLS
jgi:hypothetical protein